MKTIDAPTRRAPARMLSVQTVADYLALSTKTIRRKITSGELPVHRVGRLLRISEEDLRLYQMQRRE